MEIFGQLGINTTASIQFLLFAIVLIFLSKVVFGPYAHAVEERQRRTTGGEELATEFRHKSVELQTEYESKARELNGEIKGLMDTARVAANKEYENKVAEARAQADKLVQDNRTQITAAISNVASELKGQTTAMALAITTKLLGK